MMLSANWHAGPFEAVRKSARGKLADICSYGNIYENGCDIVDDLLDLKNRDLLLAAMAEADAEAGGGGRS